MEVFDTIELKEFDTNFPKSHISHKDKQRRRLEPVSYNFLILKLT